MIEVTNQEGRRFWGTQTFSGNGEKKTQEPMIGELTGKDNKTIVLVDTDGYLNGQLINNNTLSFCYTQAGGKTEFERGELHRDQTHAATRAVRVLRPLQASCPGRPRARSDPGDQSRPSTSLMELENAEAR